MISGLIESFAEKQSLLYFIVGLVLFTFLISPVETLLSSFFIVIGHTLLLALLTAGACKLANSKFNPKKFLSGYSAILFLGIVFIIVLTLISYFLPTSLENNETIFTIFGGFAIILSLVLFYAFYRLVDLFLPTKFGTTLLFSIIAWFFSFYLLFFF